MALIRSLNSGISPCVTVKKCVRVSAKFEAKKYTSCTIYHVPESPKIAYPKTSKIVNSHRVTCTDTVSSYTYSNDADADALSLSYLSL